MILVDFRPFFHISVILTLFIGIGIKCIFRYMTLYCLYYLGPTSSLRNRLHRQGSSFWSILVILVILAILLKMTSYLAMYICKITKSEISSLFHDFMIFYKIIFIIFTILWFFKKRSYFLGITYFCKFVKL